MPAPGPSGNPATYQTMRSSVQKTKKDKDQVRVEAEVIVRQAETFNMKMEPMKMEPMRIQDTFTFVSSEMSLGGKVVKGAPYSAEAVTESVQTLADGNRIVRKNTAQVYRDSEGRTRREQTINILGHYAPAGEAPRTILINDPVSGEHFSLDPRHRTARKLTVVRVDNQVLGTAEQKRLAEGAAKRVLEQGFVYTTPVPPPAGALGSGPNVYF